MNKREIEQAQEVIESVRTGKGPLEPLEAAFPEKSPTLDFERRAEVSALLELAEDANALEVALFKIVWDRDVARGLKYTLTDTDNWAKDFHDTYERIAPQFGYKTRKESAVPWNEVPQPNRNLMIAVCAEVLCRFAQTRGQK